MAAHPAEGVIGLERLKDHYKHCIRLSASNKINPKNAFDLQLIDYMQDLVSNAEDGQMNFKIASSALDVGAKIYSSRVDCIQSEAQKVASSILLALDGQKGDNNNDVDQNNSPNDTTTNSDLNDNDDNDAGAQVKAARRKTRKSVKTVVEDVAMLDLKFEQHILGDPFLDGLSRDYDMSCPAALICYNPLTQPIGLLTVESNNSRKNYQEQATSTAVDNTSPYNSVSLITTSKHVNLAQIIRNNLQNHSICSRLNNFLFNDKSTKISGFNTNLDDTMETSEPQKAETKHPVGGEHEFDPELYNNDAGNDDYSDNGGDFAGNDVSNNENDLIPDLDKIAATKPTDYSYAAEPQRLKNTWAGPYAWKVVKVPQSTRKDGEPRSTRKRVKLEQMPIDWSEDCPPVNYEIVEKGIRHTSNALRKWTKKPFKPQDHNFTEESAKEIVEHTFLRPEDTYNCVKSAAEALKCVDNDHAYANKNGVTSAQESPDIGGFDVNDDDSDDEFRVDPVDGDGNGALNTSTQQSDLEFAGEHLIEQPYQVAQVVIPFAKVAKKMDVRKLKHVMWNLIIPPESRESSRLESANVTVIENLNVGGDKSTIVDDNDKTDPASKKTSESLVHLEFSNLYGELPVRVSSKMASDLSQPIAFVTLLHLANEKNLRLIPNEDLKDFVIEQD